MLDECLHWIRQPREASSEEEVMPIGRPTVDGGVDAPSDVEQLTLEEGEPDALCALGHRGRLGVHNDVVELEAQLARSQVDLGVPLEPSRFERPAEAEIVLCVQSGLEVVEFEEDLVA